VSQYRCLALFLAALMVLFLARTYANPGKNQKPGALRADKADAAYCVVLGLLYTNCLFMHGGSAMELTPQLATFIRETADSLSGPPRRRYMARALDQLGLSQRQAQRCLGWSRDTLRKAQHEARSGITCCDATSCRGRKLAEVHLPHLLDDIRAIAQDHCQTDPTFQTSRLYCRLTAAEVRRQLIERKGYTDEQLPCRQTIGAKLNALGLRLRKVAKCRPQKSPADRSHLRQRQGGP